MKTSDITDLMVCQAVLASYWEWRNGIYASHQKPRNSVTTLIDMTGAPEKVAYSALERADNRRLIGYGCAIRYCWLEPLGEQLMETSR